jgi:hypothetical protein
MDTLHTTLSLLRRHALLEARLQYPNPDPSDVRTEWELERIRARLKYSPATIRVILETAQRLRRPVEALSIADLQ